MDVDDMLSQAGDRGRYQVMLVALFAIINVLSAYHYFGQTFISLVPEHYCHLPDVDQANVSLYRARDGLCSRYDRNLSGVEPPQPENDWPTRYCNTGWEYRLEENYTTIISEMHWVCADAWKVATGQSLFFVGSVIGTLALGVLSDRTGRLPTLVVANVLALLGNLATAFVTSLPDFGAARFLAGLATDANFFMMYIIVMEYLRPQFRTAGLNLTIGVFYSLGCVAVPWTALWLHTWRRLMLVVAAMHAVVPGYMFVVPESARWLLQQGRVNDALKCFQRVAKYNGKELDAVHVKMFQNSVKTDKNPSGSLLGLFRTPRLRRKTLILIFKSMVLTLCYDAISRNVDGLPWSPFIMFSISSATILPSCIVILLLQDRVGRKALASGSLFLTGIFTALAGIVLGWKPGMADAHVAMVLAVVGRLGVNIAYNSGVQYAAELIPTEVRGQGVAAMHVAGYGATFCSPYILYLAEYWSAIPDLLLGMLAMIGAALCLLLPETLHRELPVTLADGEEFGEGERIWEFAWRQRRDDKKPAGSSTKVCDVQGITAHTAT
ncbi:organic cation transporter protein isoform X2 [Anabrus simplex]